MKTELEKKLNKLPEYISLDNIFYFLLIRKNNSHWVIEYVDLITENTLFLVSYQSLQAVVDTTLKEIKKINNEYWRNNRKSN